MELEWSPSALLTDSYLVLVSPVSSVQACGMTCLSCLFSFLLTEEPSLMASSWMLSANTVAWGGCVSGLL